jgi:glutamate/aspartate transport system substrate-binding protein
MKNFAALTLLTTLTVLTVSAHAAPAPDTLAKIKATKTITLAYAPDSAPFAFSESKTDTPMGYSINLCERVVNHLQSQLGLDQIKIKWVAGSTAERLDMVATGKADMECGVTTTTLKRQERVDFSNMIYLQSGSVLARGDSGITSSRELAGKKVAVVAGTTTQTRFTQALAKAGIAAEVQVFKNRDEAFKALESNQVHALAGDKLVLVGLVAREQEKQRYNLLSQDFSVEPYALALRRGDANFRLAVNRGLARTYGSGEIVPIFDRWFAPFKPSEVLMGIYTLSAMED